MEGGGARNIYPLIVRPRRRKWASLLGLATQDLVPSLPSELTDCFKIHSSEGCKYLEGTLKLLFTHTEDVSCLPKHHQTYCVLLSWCLRGHDCHSYMPGTLEVGTCII